MTSKILLVGAFGQRNPGDEALLTAFLRGLDGFDITVASSDPAHTAVMHGCRAIPGTTVAVGQALRSCDALVYGGGTVFKALAPSTGRTPNALLRNALLLARGARAMGMPVAMVGVGAAPLVGGVATGLATALVKSCDLLVLRDRESAQILHRAGAPVPLRVGADPVWTVLAEPPPPPAYGRELLVALSTHAAPGSPHGAIADAVADAARGLQGMDRIRLQPWQVGQRGYDDLDLARDIERRLAGSVVEVVVEAPPESVHAARDGMRTAAVVLALRMHALVAAGAAGRPVVAVGHEPKLASLAARLHQPVVSLDDGTARIVECLEAARAAGGPARADVQVEIAAAASMMRLLRLVLTSGRESADLGGLALEPVGVLR